MFIKDIVLLRVSDAIPDNFIIEMASPQDDFTGQTCIISGWGASSKFANFLVLFIFFFFFVFFFPFRQHNQLSLTVIRCINNSTIFDFSCLVSFPLDKQKK